MYEDRTTAGALSTAADHPVILSDGSPPLTRQALRNDALGLRHRVPRGATVALVGPGSRLVAAAIVALEGWAARVELVGDLSPAVSSPDAVVLRSDEIDGVPGPPSTDDGASTRGEVDQVHTAWRLFSSGTTGLPTPTDHSLDSLTRRTRPADNRLDRGDRESRRWGLLYPPMRMAGIQVLLQAIHGGDSLVDAGTAELEARLDRFVRSGVDALSATPTMWRMILRSRAGDRLPLRQITMGGEIATQSLLNALRNRFGARITHVYASTEAGAAFSVNDAIEGFPRHYLDTPPGGVALDVRDGVLFVHAPGSSTAAPDGFVSTGDLVELRGDRVYFVGRASGLVNVGGDKVSPERVEETLRQHPAVQDAVVVPRRSSITGWVLTSEVVLAPSNDGLAPGDLRSALRAFVTEQLSRSHAPARITVVSELSLSSTGKASRA
ncbi:AMP-binding protein [Micromonospora sp. Llam7]|uniref:AMP-binding protein n=1 Tax=Micromonospora tarapacensis TaxID=2835305 RepID=UPI001C83CB7E|nr:AMP-binding protein [Micromonospora tarapacensis]